MKKSVLFILAIFLTADLFSQINKGNLIISLDGNYMEVNTGAGVTTNQSNTNGHYLQIGSSIGYFLTDKWVAGIGLDYNREKEMRYNTLYFNMFYQAEEMNITSKSYLPYLFLGYYYPIIPKLYFNAKIKFSYGEITSEIHTLYAGAEVLSTDSPYMGEISTSYAASFTSQSEFKYFSAGISPEIAYFVAARWGVYLGLGEIEYEMIDWKSDHSDWIVNFNPNHWRLGIKMKI